MTVSYVALAKGLYEKTPEGFDPTVGFVVLSRARERHTDVWWLYLLDDPRLHPWVEDKTQ